MQWDWEKFYNKAYDWLLSNGPKLLLAILIFFLGLWLIRLFNRWVRRGMERHNFNPTLRYFLQNLIALTLQFLLVLLALQIAGIRLTFFTAIVAGLSVAFGLALSGTLQNFVSGILILILKPYRVGDIVNIQSQEGTVTSIQIFYTTVLTYDNKTITVPNGQLSNNVIINLSKEGTRRLDIEIRFNYDIDYDRVKGILFSAVNPDKNLNDTHPVEIGVSALEADKYVVTIYVWVQAKNFIDARLKLQEKILYALKNAGVKLPGMA